MGLTCIVFEKQHFQVALGCWFFNAIRGLLSRPRPNTNKHNFLKFKASSLFFFHLILITGIYSSKYKYFLSQKIWKVRQHWLSTHPLPLNMIPLCVANCLIASVIQQILLTVCSCYCKYMMTSLLPASPIKIILINI